MKERKEIWTIDLSDILNEEGINHKMCVNPYDSMDAAIQAAQDIVKEFMGDERVVEAVVYQGEYMDGSGNILGEPYDIYCATNTRPYVSANARLQAGFERIYVDFYAEDPIVPCELTYYNGKAYKSALVVSPDEMDKGCDWLIVENSLSKILIGDDGDPVDRSAEIEDSLIYAYCPTEYFELTESEFCKRIIKEFS